MALLQGTVGPGSPKSADGTSPPSGARQGNQNDVIVSELHGRYYEQAYRKILATAANVAFATTSAGLATTATGLIISNPIGNIFNLVLEKIGWTMAVAPAAAYFVGWAQGFSATTNVVHTTPITPQFAFYGASGAPTAKIDSAATLPAAPTYQVILGGGGGAVYNGASIYDLEGSILIPPGGYGIIATSIASGASGFAGSFMWEEVPV
jgi:hypothetical protein